MTNTGDAALEFTAALHTYLAVSSVGHVELRGGFEGCEYLDKLDGLTKRALSPTLTLTLSLRPNPKPKPNPKPNPDSNPNPNLDKLDGLTKRDAYPDPTPNPRAACLP